MGIERRTHSLMAVIAALLKSPDDDHYGLELARIAGIRPGSIYPILVRLEGKGWISGHWEDIDESAEGRRKRKYFRLTGVGAKQAAGELAMWRQEFLRPPILAPRLGGTTA
ncbi:MAG: PadR family transcriptional regulator [Actinomycetota bacterium]|nr:PadR family transcriptional regulator [Actinomycetota bacterium]